MIEHNDKSLLQVTIHGSVGTIILDRPEKRNALSREMLADLNRAFVDLHGRREVHSVILTGRGLAFCAGSDLAEIDVTGRSNDPESQWYRDAAAARDLLTTMLRFPKPVVAAVNGAALGTGVGLVLACDLVVAGSASSFGCPEPRRGLVAGMIAPLLAYRIGAGLATRILLTAREIDAVTAHSFGLVHEIVETDKVWSRAVEWSAECSRSAPESLLLTKRMLNETIGEPLFTWLAAGASATATARTTEAAAEGVAAFIEHREPKWD